MPADLIQVAENTFYLPGPVNVGFVRLSPTEVCLIDSGNDKSAARAIRKIADARKWQLTAIYCTHSHADHIGGCAYLQSQTGCRVYAPGAECCFTRYPALEPALLYGGYPPRQLRGKFLMAKGCDATPLDAESLPGALSALPLPGHSDAMVGYRTADDVLFVADALLSRATLEKYRISYVYDVAAHLRTLEQLQSMQAALFIPAHAEVCDSIADLARYNAEQTLAVAECIVSLCGEPIGTDALLQKLFDTYHLTMTHEQHALISCTLRSYLSWLCDAGRLCALYHDNMLRWLRA